jgi:glucuronate isomerase
VPATLRNPLYHWTHLELVRYFGIEETLNETTAPAIWEQANAQLATPALSAWGILERFKVKALCTTDDPADDLATHKAIAASACPAKVYPTFRPDRAFLVDQPGAFNTWVGRLGAAANLDIADFQSFCDALAKRHDAFHEVGGRLSDHGLNHAFAAPCTDSQASEIFESARAFKAASPDDKQAFASWLMLFFGRLDAAKGWTKQIHLGAYRSANTRALAQLGPDTGFDSIGDWPQVESLGRYLDTLEQEGALPKVILYNLNPAWNYAFATMAGNFQDGVTPGKIQFGSGWWFLDQKEAMEWQMNALSNCGLLSRFAGMLTDSRSFMSYPRHEYFRRVLCNLIGRDMESGEVPNDMELVGAMVRNICFANARDYFGLALG